LPFRFSTKPNWQLRDEILSRSAWCAAVPHPTKVPWGIFENGARYQFKDLLHAARGITNPQHLNYKVILMGDSTMKNMATDCRDIAAYWKSIGKNAKIPVHIPEMTTVVDVSDSGANSTWLESQFSQSGKAHSYVFEGSTPLKISCEIFWSHAQ
jgi:hypothetical protein